MTSFPGHSPSVLRLPAYLQAVYAPGAGAEGHPPNLRFSPHLVVPPKRALALLMGRAHGPPFPLRCMGLYAASALSHTPVHYRPYGLRCKEKLTREPVLFFSRRQPGQCFCTSGLPLTSVTDGSLKAWRGQFLAIRQEISRLFHRQFSLRSFGRSAKNLWRTTCNSRSA